MKKMLKQWKWTGISLIGIVLLGFFLRIYNLTILPVFVDEAIYIRWAQIMASESTLRFLPLSDGKQPLFMWVLMFLIERFSDPLFIGRLLSVASGIGTMFGIFVFSYLLFKSKLVSIFSVFFYSISPFSVFFDRIALVDSMLSMFGIWTAVFGFLTVKYKRLDYALITGFFLGFATLTKSPAIFFALLLPIFWILEDWTGTWKKRFEQFVKLTILLAVTYIVAYGMYSIQRLGPNFHLLSSRTVDYVFPISHFWTNFKDPLIPYLKDVGVWFWAMGPNLLLPLTVLGVYFGIKKNLKETLVLLAWFLVPVLIQAEFARVFTARYIYFTLPYFFILSGLVFLNKSKKLQKLVWLIVAAFILQAVNFDFLLLTQPEKANLTRGERSGYLEEWTAGQGIYEVAQYIRNEELKNPGAMIVVGTDGYFGTLPDGLQIYLNDIDNVVVIGVGVIIEDTPKSLIESVEAGNKTYLVVNKSRFKGNADAQGFKLISSFPKALRLIDSKQYVQHGPQEALFFFEVN